MGNRTRDLTACSIVPQQTKLPRIYDKSEVKFFQSMISGLLMLM
jgi:hypothetical protein